MSDDVIKIFRREMAFFGHPIDHLSDEELLERAAAASEVYISFGIGVEDAYDAFVEGARIYSEMAHEQYD